jgi:hypothetical protein
MVEAACGSAQDFGGGNLGYLGQPELEALPTALQPLVKHLCLHGLAPPGAVKRRLHFQ